MVLLSRACGDLVKSLWRSRRALVGEVGGVLDVQELGNGPQRLTLPPGELLALSAIVAERREPARAASEWQQLVQSQPRSPWVAHAKTRVEALSRGRATKGAVE